MKFDCTLSLPALFLKLDRSLVKLFESRAGSVVDGVILRFDRIDANCSDISFKNAMGSVFSLLLSILLAPLFELSSLPPSVELFVKRFCSGPDPGET